MNSRLTHTRPKVDARVRGDIDAPSVPNRLGITTVKPASTTSGPNVATSGVMPGISWITITPGPSPCGTSGA